MSSEKPYFDRNFVCCTKKFNDKMVFLYFEARSLEQKFELKTWDKNLNSKLGNKNLKSKHGTKI